MADASFQQSSFLGGEWSSTAAGRFDDPHYKSALAICSNGYPMEDGSWTKRSGFKDLGPSRSGTLARYVALNMSATNPFEVELTDGLLRVWAGDTLVQDSVAQVLNVTTDFPMEIFVDGNSANWATGDDIYLTLTAGDASAMGNVLARQLRLTKVVDRTFSLSDPVTGAGIDGSQVTWDPSTMTLTASRVAAFVTPWTGTSFQSVMGATFGNQVYLFHISYPPQVLTVAPAFGAPAASGLTFAAAVFTDGPYFDAVDGQTAQVSGTSGSITFTAANGVGPLQVAFVAGDVGRLIRILSQPLDWDSITVYSKNDHVLLNNLPYTALKTTQAGSAPNLTPQEWSPDTDAQAWSWGIVTAFLGATQVTLALQTPLLYATTVRSWRMGKFGDPTVGYPRTGAVHEGRLWLDWVNTLNASQSNKPTNMAPTLPDGTVTDASAITGTLEGGDQDSNFVNWMQTDLAGLLVSTEAGEWIVKASNLDDPITAFSIQARRVTKYASAFIRPVRSPLSTIFVQRYGRKVMEFLGDVFTGRYVAPNLSAMARHLTIGGVQELGYQEENTPIVWLRAASVLRGITYRRTSAFITEAPAFVGWHRHTHGDGRSIEALVTTSSAADATTDALYVLTHATAANAYRYQRLTRQFDLGDPLAAAFFLDSGAVPTAMRDNGTGVTLYGLSVHANRDVRMMIGGIDVGTVTIDGFGSVTVPYAAPLTAAYLQSLQSQQYWGRVNEMATPLSFVTDTTPTRAIAPATIGNYLNSTLPASGSIVDVSAAPDFAHGRFFAMAWDPSAGTGSFRLRSFNLTTRAQLATSLATAYFPAPGGVRILGPINTGALLLQMEEALSSMLVKVDPTTLAQISTYGTTSSSGNPMDGLPRSIMSAATIVNNNEYLISLGAQGGPIGVVNTTLMQIATRPITMPINADFVRAGPISQGASSVIFMRGGTNVTSAPMQELTIESGAEIWSSVFGSWYSGGSYMTGQKIERNGGLFLALNPSTGVDPATDGLEVDWQLQPSSFIKLLSRGSLAIATVDATWTHMTINDVGYDRTDGTLIVACSTDNAVAHQNRLVKVRVLDGSVLWSTPIAGAVTVSGLGAARIQGGRLGYLDASGTVYSINTVSGAIDFSFTTHAGPAAQVQMMDAGTGQILALFNYNSGTSGAPTPLSGTPSTFNELATYTPGTALIGSTSTVVKYSVSAVAGFPYTAEGQVLRPLAPEPSGARNGPALGKTRRNHQFAALLQDTQKISFGTSAASKRPAKFQSPGGTAYTAQQLFSGVYWNTVEDTYSFDGMLYWASSDPYPLTLVSLEGFLHTQDR